MQKLLVVGAGFGQIPAIKKAKELGLIVITVDINPDALGREWADDFYLVDITDEEAVLSVAKEHQIDGVMTMQSEYGIPAVGLVNEELNLNGITYDVSTNCSNKIELRKKLYKKGCSQPQFKFVSSFVEAKDAATELGYPCIIKAPDSSGSRGVIKVNSPKDIGDAINTAYRYTQSDTVIVEEFIDGLEFGAQTFSVDGNCDLVLLHNDTLSSPPYMIPIGHSFPFNKLKDEKRQEVVDDIKKAVKALEINEGPANIDLILDAKNEKVKIIEIGARIGATCLPELVKYHTGIDWVQETIKNAIGEEINLQVTESNPIAALILEAPKNGLYKGYNLKVNPENYNVVEFEVTAQLNKEVHQLRKGTDRIGKIITRGMNALDAEKNAKDFRNLLEIEVK